MTAGSMTEAAPDEMHRGRAAHLRRRWLLASTWSMVALSLLGMGLGLAGIQPGSPVVPLAERMAYLARGPVLWTMAWCAWALCALSLMATFFGIALHVRKRSVLLGAGLSVAGGAVDALCIMTQGLVLPELASQAGGIPAFLAVEKTTAVGNMVVGPAFYAAGILLVTASLGREARRARAAGLVAALSNTLMVVSGFSGSGVFMGTAAAIGAIGICAWALVLTRTLAAPVSPRGDDRRSSSAGAAESG